MVTTNETRGRGVWCGKIAVRWEMVIGCLED